MARLDSITRFAAPRVLSSGMPALAPPPIAGLPWWYDIASGDLDKHAAADSNYRDEVVVAYATQSTDPNNFHWIVAVLDYAANASAPTVTWKESGGIYKWSFSGGRDVPEIPVSVVTGDFDGDTRKEIAVAYLMHWHAVGIAVFRYTTRD